MNKRVVPFVFAVCLAGLLVAIGAAFTWKDEDWGFLAALAAITVVSEFVDFSPFPNNRVSLSICMIMAGGALMGLPGAAVVAGATAAADYAAHRKHPGKAAFNLGALLLTGGAYVGMLEALAFTYDEGDWLAMLGPAMAASIAAFACNSGLVALAIAIDRGEDALGVWSEYFRWLLPHYVVLGAIALLMAMAQDRWGIEGLALLLAPLAGAWLVVKQYTEHMEARTARGHAGVG